MDGWMDWMDGCMDGWMDGGKTGLMKEEKKNPNAVVILGFFIIYKLFFFLHYYNFLFSSAYTESHSTRSKTRALFCTQRKTFELLTWFFFLVACNVFFSFPLRKLKVIRHGVKLGPCFVRSVKPSCF